MEHILKHEDYMIHFEEAKILSLTLHYVTHLHCEAIEIYNNTKEERAED